MLNADICASASAVAVERVFSGGRDTISLRRASLKPETIRVLMLLKHKLHLSRREFLKGVKKEATSLFGVSPGFAFSGGR